MQNAAPPAQLLRKRMLGMAGAAIWLVAISAAFTVLSLIMIGTATTRIVLAGVLIAVIAYIAIGVAVIRAIPRSHGAAPPRTAGARIMLRRFVLVVAAEVIAIMVVNGICVGARRLELTTPLDLMIIGIHFLPLAWIFRVPRYYWTGAFFCLPPLITLALVPVHAKVGAADAWFVIPAFGCTAVAWVTAAFNLREVWQSIPRRSSVGQAIAGS